MRLQKGDQGAEERRLPSSAAKLVCPDSGQVEEALRPALVAKRCRKRGKGKSHRIIWCLGIHALETAVSE